LQLHHAHRMTDAELLRMFARPMAAGTFTLVTGMDAAEAGRKLRGWVEAGLLSETRGGLFAKPSAGQRMPAPVQARAPAVTPPSVVTPVAAPEAAPRRRRAPRARPSVDRVRDIIARSGPVPVGRVARAMGLSHARVSSIVKDLVAEGAVEAALDPEGTRLFDGGVLYVAAGMQPVLHRRGLPPSAAWARWRGVALEVLSDWMIEEDAVRGMGGLEEHRAALGKGVASGEVARREDGCLKAARNLYCSERRTRMRQRSFALQRSIGGVTTPPALSVAMGVSRQRGHQVLGKAVGEGTAFRVGRRQFASFTHAYALTRVVPEAWRVPLRETGVPDRLAECLAAAGIELVGDLGKVPPADLRFIPSVGEGDVGVLETVMASRGVRPGSVPEFLDLGLLMENPVEPAAAPPPSVSYSPLLREFEEWSTIADFAEVSGLGLSEAERMAEAWLAEGTLVSTGPDPVRYALALGRRETFRHASVLDFGVASRQAVFAEANADERRLLVRRARVRQGLASIAEVADYLGVTEDAVADLG